MISNGVRKLSNERDEKKSGVPAAICNPIPQGTDSLNETDEKNFKVGGVEPPAKQKTPMCRAALVEALTS